MEPLSRMMEAWEGLQAGTLPKDCVNAAIGMFVAVDEPIVTQHFCGPPAERPEGFWREIDLGNCDAQDWTCDVEARSFESLRPIWSQIMQLEATRTALLLESLERIPGFVSGKHIVQAKVDAWHVSVSHKMATEVEKLDAKTIAHKGGARPRLLMVEVKWVEPMAGSDSVRVIAGHLHNAVAQKRAALTSNIF